MTVLQICSEVEIEEADTTGEVRGYTMDKLSRMSSRTMQKALLKAEEAKKKAVAKATGEVLDDNAALREKVDGLEAELQRAGSPLDQALALIKAAENQVLGGIAKLARIPEEVLAREKVAQDMILGMLGLGLRALANLETRALVAMAERQVRDGEVELDPPCER